MSLVKNSGKMGLLALTLIAAPFAQAQTSGWYLGANVGQSSAKLDDARITSGLLGAGFTTTSISDDDRDTGFKLFGGYQFNRYLAMEGGYFDLGKFGFTASTLPLGTLTGQLKAKGFNLDLVGSLPFTEKFSAFGRVGVTSAEAKDAFAGTGFVQVLQPRTSERATNLKFGGGLQYNFTKSVGMRLEMERYRINDAFGNKGDLDLVSLGVLYRFGRHQAAPVAEPVATPAPAPAAAPGAVVVIAPAVVHNQEYCTILELQFEIDRDEIQRDDREKLAVVGTFMAKYPETTAVIEGHSDNVGDPEHNLTLSRNRATSVVTYLVDDLHIAPARLKAVGYGDSRPVADNATEEGKRQNRRIGAVISCASDIEGLTVKPARITMAMVVEFDPNKATIQASYEPELRKVAKFLKANPFVTATVEGHTGNLQGTPAQAMEISLLRAQNVVNYLVDSGINRSRLSAQGFGKARLNAYNQSEEGQQENRRVNIIINYPK